METKTIKVAVLGTGDSKLSSRLRLLGLAVSLSHTMTLAEKLGDMMPMTIPARSNDKPYLKAKKGRAKYT